MKLFHNIASPFVRKVRVLAVETGQSARIELVQSVFTPVQPDRGALRLQPARQDSDPAARRRERALRFPRDLRVPGQPARGSEDVSGRGPRALGRAYPAGPGRRHPRRGGRHALRARPCATRPGSGRSGSRTSARSTGARSTRWRRSRRPWTGPSTSASSPQPARSATSISAIRTRDGGTLARASPSGTPPSGSATRCVAPHRSSRGPR